MCVNFRLTYCTINKVLYPHYSIRKYQSMNHYQTLFSLVFYFWNFISTSLLYRIQNKSQKRFSFQFSFKIICFNQYFRQYTNFWMFFISKVFYIVKGWNMERTVRYDQICNFFQGLKCMLKDSRIGVAILPNTFEAKTLGMPIRDSHCPCSNPHDSTSSYLLLLAR